MANNNSEVIEAFANVVGANDLSTCHDLAYRIACSVDYFTKAEKCQVGTQLLGFPMSVAYGCFRFLQRRDLVWFKIIYQRLESMDVRLPGILYDMASACKAPVPHGKYISKAVRGDDSTKLE